MQEYFRKFLRLEIDFDEFRKNVPLNFDGTDNIKELLADEESDGECVYKPEVDDFIVAATNAQLSGNPAKVFTKWFCTLHFILREFYGFDKLEEEYGDFILAVPFSEEEAVWHIYELIKFRFLLEEALSADEIMIAVIQAGEMYKLNKFKEKDEYELTDEQINGFMSIYRDDKAIEELDASDKVRVREIIEEGVKRELEMALEVKGYALYGGNALYDTNWDECCLIFEKLYEKTNFPGYANTLGYIYYYGRANGGKPEYDKAFKYFTIGHLDGYFESTYKLADMLANGMGVPKSPRKAVALVAEIYNVNFERFCRGDYTVKLADVALRLGSYFENGTAVDASLEDAYMYYLMAEYAIAKRMDTEEQYGDNSVMERIAISLDRVRKKMEKENIEFKDISEYDYLPILNKTLAGDSYAMIKVSREMDGEVRFDFRGHILNQNGKEADRNILWSDPVLGKCRFSNEFTIYAKGDYSDIIKCLDKDINTNEDSFTVMVDDIDPIYAKEEEDPEIDETVDLESMLEDIETLSELRSTEKNNNNPIGYILTYLGNVEFRIDSDKFFIKMETYNQE